MQYELYIDVFLINNFFLDLLILAIVRKILRYKSSVFRLAGAAMFGAAGLCFFILLPIRQYILIQILFYCCIYVGMCFIGFKITSIKSLLKCLLIMYAVSLFISGLYVQCAAKIHHFNVLMISIVMIYTLVSGVLHIYRRLRASEDNICPVTILIHHKRLQLTGLWDTGNRLKSPYTGKGVSVVGLQDIKDYLTDENIKKIEHLHQLDQKNDSMNTFGQDGDELGSDSSILLLPYQTVGNALGFMPVIEADKMYIRKNGAVLEYTRPLLGISEHGVCKNKNYQMILTTDGICE